MNSPYAASGSRNEETRRRNLAAILGTVHYAGPASRADLTRLTGLNRSTIKVLVDELVRLDMVFESTAPATQSVGRPSPLVNANSEIAALAINPDVDAVIVGIVGLGGIVKSRRRYPTSGIPSVADVIAIARTAQGELDDGGDVRAIGLAVPGLVSAANGTVVHAPHLGWRDEPVAELFAAAFELPVAVANDASAGLLAETRFGAARGMQDILFLNGSTSGIGGGAVIGGHVIAGARGFAGELGHTTVTNPGLACDCGRHGCLETEVNLQRFEEAAGDAQFDPDNLDEALLNPSPAIAAEADRQVDVLAIAIGDAVSTLNPGVVVLGGFLGALLTARTERLTAAVRRESFTPLAHDLAVVRAVLGTNRLMIGAADLALTPLLTDPLGVVAGH